MKQAILCRSTMSARVRECADPDSANLAPHPTTSSCAHTQSYLVPRVHADGKALGELQEGDVELLRLPSPVPEVAVAVVPSHADLTGLGCFFVSDVFSKGENVTISKE